MNCLFLYAAFFHFGDILWNYVNQIGVMSTIRQFMSTSLVDITQKQAYKIRIFMFLSARGQDNSGKGHNEGRMAPDGAR